MPRPKSKAELVTASRESFDQLNEMIKSIPVSCLEEEFPFNHRDRNARDVLAHLHEWQKMMLRWYKTGMEGLTPDMPAPGHTWKTTPELNAEIWIKYQSVSLKQVQGNLARSHKDLMKIIDSHTNRELFTKRLYDWTRSTSLGSYLTSSLSSHYQWAIKIFRKLIRSIEQSSDDIIRKA